MNIVLAQIQVYPGEIQKNLKTALDYVEIAKEQKADIVVFSELCLSGYLISDLWEELTFVEECIEAGEELASASNGITIVFGNVAQQETELGENGRKRLYNAVFCAQEGVFLKNTPLQESFFPKTLLPNYREFDDARYFYDLRKLSFEKDLAISSLLFPVEIKGVKVGLSICEDGWGKDYGIEPLDLLVKNGAELLINLSCSPFTLGKKEKRDRVFSGFAKSHQVPLYYCNNVGVQNNGKTVYAFDGASTIYNAQGEVVSVAPRYEPKLLSLQDEISPEAVVGNHIEYALQEFLKTSGLSKVVVGASGGVDSAVVATLLAKVLGPENLLLVNMPSKYNSSTTKNLAAELAENLGCWYTTVSIQESADLTAKQIHGLSIQKGEKEKVLQLSDFHMENVQARDRSSRVLSAVGCAFGGVFSCNANKAELTVGYSTLYGDHGGFLAPLADLWKEEVYALGHWLNTEMGNVIPSKVFDIVPCAELSDNHDIDQDMGDPLKYWYHDRLFKSWVENWNRLSPYEILLAYHNNELDTLLTLPQPILSLFPDVKSFIQDLERWWVNFKGMGVVKRVQSPPIVAITRRAFGYDYRESILPVLYAKKYLKLKETLLVDSL